MENLEIIEKEGQLIITFIGSDEERKELNMEEVNNYLADIGVSRELNEKEFYRLYDEGEVMVEIKKAQDLKTEIDLEQQEIKKEKMYSLRDDRFALYNKCRGRLVREIFEEYFDENWWIERAVIRMGAASYEIYKFIENGELWGDYDQITGPVPIRLLEKIVTEDIKLRCTGIDERPCLGYKKRKDENHIYIEVLVDMGNDILKGKYKLIRKEDFLRKYNM